MKFYRSKQKIVRKYRMTEKRFTFPSRKVLSACSIEEYPSVGQSGSPSASLTKKSMVSGVISASSVRNGAEADSSKAPNRDPFSLPFKKLSSDALPPPIAQHVGLNSLCLNRSAPIPIPRGVSKSLRKLQQNHH